MALCLWLDSRYFRTFLVDSVIPEAIVATHGQCQQGVASGWHFVAYLCVSMQAEGEKLSLDLLLRHMESGINIFSDTERELLQQHRHTSETI